MFLPVYFGHFSFYVYEKDMEGILSTIECIPLVV